MVTFKLQKLKILAYDKPERVGTPGTDDTFEAMFNPTSYSLTYKNDICIYKSADSIGSESRFSQSEPSELSITLLLDKTGATSFGVERLLGSTDISTDVQKFLKITRDVDPDMHEPKYLKVTWGTLEFDCRLASVEIKYTLFSRSGNPLRAELAVRFQSDTRPIDQSNKNSADLTRVSTVNGSDTLPLLAAKMYDDPLYYMQIAMANGLNNFRKLEPGRSLVFPPLKK
ncbi:MAG: hypothetical protein JW712_03410 [Dehalococcoidales bacterium]|nr:hypothetical protein [Dehalococcoidales bacterium]